MTNRRAQTQDPVARPADTGEPGCGPLGDLRFRALLGAGQWAGLPAAVRHRFSKRLAGNGSAVYCGEITGARMNAAGWMLAQAARLVGGPLPLHRETGTPATVVVTEDPATGGQFWTRMYGRGRGFPQVIHSAKRFAGPTGLEEYVGRGIGMALTIDATASALHFRSDHYFLLLFGRRLRLPGWAGPGRVTVSHIDLGGGRFTFELLLRHPWFGVMIHQTALFRDGAGEVIPMLADNDPFDRFPLSARQTRFAPWCRAPQAGRNEASGQGKPACGGTRRPARCVAALARCGGIAPRTAPARRAAARHQMGHYRRALVFAS